MKIYNLKRIAKIKAVKFAVWAVGKPKPNFGIALRVRPHSNENIKSRKCYVKCLQYQLPTKKLSFKLFKFMDEIYTALEKTGVLPVPACAHRRRNVWLADECAKPII